MKIVGYGMGYIFDTYRDFIEAEFEVIAWCDKDVNMCYKGGDKYISPAQLRKIDIETYDKVLILPVKVEISIEICNYLVDQINIPLDKILFIDQTAILNQRNKVMPKEIYYGQYSDDSIIKNIFYEMGLDIEHVTYLELGVYDPIQISNTYLFYKNGGSGVLVDANPLISNKIKIVRGRDNFLNYAIAGETKQEKVPFWICETSQALSTFNRDWMIKLHNIVPESFKKVMVSVIGINDLLGKIDFVPDLVSIDIEGNDKEVIMAWDFKLIKPKIFVIEDKSFEVIDYMMKNGYTWYTTGVGNSFFVLEMD